MKLVGILMTKLKTLILSFPSAGYHGKRSQDKTGGERQRQPVQRVSHRDLPGPRHPERDRLQQVGHIVKWSHGHIVKWSHGHMVTWSHSHLVTWSLGHLVTWSLGHLVTWSLGHSITIFNMLTDGLTHNIRIYRSASQTNT